MIPDIKEIKHNRMLLGLTQKDLASKTGISQSIIAKIESNKVSPSYEIIKRFMQDGRLDEQDMLKLIANHKSF